jgi:hypothetical protein
MKQVPNPLSCLARDGISMVLGRPILYKYKIWGSDQYFLLYWVFLDIIPN